MHRVREIGLRARRLQHRFQKHFYKHCADEHFALRQQVLQLQLDFKELELEFAHDADSKLLAQVAREVKRVAWYEEDTMHVFEQLKTLENKLANAELRAARSEERNQQLDQQLVTAETQWAVCTQSNLELRDQLTEQLHTHKHEMAYLRTELRKYMTCVARDSVCPKNMLHLLVDQPTKALSVLLAHAKRAPLHVDGLGVALLQLAGDHPEHAAQALSVLTHVSDIKVLRKKSGLLRRICRDQKIRSVALPQLSSILCQLSNEACTHEERLDIARATTSVWRAQGSVVQAVANLTLVDVNLFVSECTVARLVALLHGPERNAPVLVALNNLCALKKVQNTLLKNNTFLDAVVVCLRGNDPSLQLLRQQACVTLTNLAKEGPTVRRRIVVAQAFPFLFKMVQSEHASEFEAAMATVIVLLEDEFFVHMLHLIPDFLIEVIVRMQDSDVAVELLATLFVHVCILKDADVNTDKAIAEKRAFLFTALRMNPVLTDVVSAALYISTSPTRRLNAVKLLWAFAQSPPDLRRVADQFLPSLCTFLRCTKTNEEMTWGITVLGQLATAFDAPTFTRHTNILLAIYRAMSHGSVDAAAMLVALTENNEAAVFIGASRMPRLTLLHIFVNSGSSEVRDCAAHAAANVYEAGEHTEKLVTNKKTEFTAAIQQMLSYKGGYTGPNGATRLSRYMSKHDGQA